MGDPKKFRKQYQTPMHPWNKESIEAEAKIKHEYGLQRKKEIFKMNSFLKKYRSIAKRLSIDDSQQAKKEAKDVLTKLHQLGLVQADANIADILSLELKDILARRLQSVVFRKGLARSMKQARQFITHRHIFVGDKEITSPSFLTTTQNEATVQFKQKSNLANESHPERSDPNKDIKEELAKIKGHKTKDTKAAAEEQSTETKKEEVTAETKKEQPVQEEQKEAIPKAAEEESKEATPKAAEESKAAPESSESTKDKK